jgi:hypothetical protein
MSRSRPRRRGAGRGPDADRDPGASGGSDDGRATGGRRNDESARHANRPSSARLASHGAHPAPRVDHRRSHRLQRRVRRDLCARLLGGDSLAQAVTTATGQPPEQRHFAAPADWPLTFVASPGGLMRVVEIPGILTTRASTRSPPQWEPGPRGAALFDARGTTWSSPYGFVALLTAGQALMSSGPKLHGCGAGHRRGRSY